MSESQGPRIAERDRVERELDAIGRADIVVGIPSYREADTIAHVVTQADEGLTGPFAELAGVVVNVDNDSPDGTRGVFEGVETGSPSLYVSTPAGVKGKGNNLLNLLWVARRLEADVVVTVDADLASITPQWIELLAEPILGGQAQYVTPIYARNEYDGTITNHICYPILRGVLDADIRQPIGGDFALSGGLAEHLLGQEWQATTREYGVDIFFTLNALLTGRSIAEVNLGAKIHKPSAPKLGPMFSQVVGTLFGRLLDYRDHWLDGRREHRVIPWSGSNGSQPQRLPVDYKGIKATALERFEAERETISDILDPENFEYVRERLEAGRMKMSMRAWARMVYDVLHAFHERDRDPRIIEAMKPLFFCRVASFIRSTLDLDHEESEARIRSQAREFRRVRRYLAAKFNGSG